MELLSELKRYFNLSSFRPGQEEVVRAVLEGRDALVVMPTGGGHQFFLKRQLRPDLLFTPCLIEFYAAHDSAV
jgi:hypothetical protein